jgi:hypothetical protein
MPRLCCRPPCRRPVHAPPTAYAAANASASTALPCPAVAAAPARAGGCHSRRNLGGTGTLVLAWCTQSVRYLRRVIAVLRCRGDGHTGQGLACHGASDTGVDAGHGVRAHSLIHVRPLTLVDWTARWEGGGGVRGHTCDADRRRRWWWWWGGGGGFSTPPASCLLYRAGSEAGALAGRSLIAQPPPSTATAPRRGVQLRSRTRAPGVRETAGTAAWW